MAGHSQFKNIMHRKGAQDRKRASVFTKIGREIQVAARSGLPDPAANPRLRTAITAARKAGMPKDNIDRAIARGSGEGGGEALEELRYEGYGPGGVAVIVEVLSDNRNRTAAELRTLFNKGNGTLGDTNAVSFLFDRCGEMTFDATTADAETMFEAAADAGANDCQTSATEHTITTDPDALSQVREMLETRFGESTRSGLVWRAQSAEPPTEPETLARFLESLDDHDDVQDVWVNTDLSALEQVS
ncbi:MAG: YebC/PmpR family DNA-binding transcriptional regulator [Pseudomonadota bacterium]